jgi:transcriptional regulator with XRE-family HTH domain
VVSSHAPNQARVIPLRPVPDPALNAGTPGRSASEDRAEPAAAPRGRPLEVPLPAPVREPLWRHIVGDVLRRERLAQQRRLKDVAEAARISMPYLSEIERGRKEASSEVLAAAAHALGLGLADLLGLAQDELARIAQARQAMVHTPATPQRDAAHPGAGATMPRVEMRLAA